MSCLRGQRGKSGREVSGRLFGFIFPSRSQLERRPQAYIHQRQHRPVCVCVLPVSAVVFPVELGPVVLLVSQASSTVVVIVTIRDALCEAKVHQRVFGLFDHAGAEGLGVDGDAHHAVCGVASRLGVVLDAALRTREGKTKAGNE